MSGVGWRFDSRAIISSDNAWLLDVIANANPVAASDYDLIIAYWRRTNRLLNRTGPDCSLQTVGAFSRAVVGLLVVDFTLVTRRRVRLLARDRQHDDLRPPCSLSRASHSSDPPTPLSVQPSHSGPITLRVMGMICSQSDGPGLPSQSEQPRRSARRGEAVSARGRCSSARASLLRILLWTAGARRNSRLRVHSPPLSPPHPLFPRFLQAALRLQIGMGLGDPMAGAPTVSVSLSPLRVRAPLSGPMQLQATLSRTRWMGPPAATAPAFRTTEQGAARWGRQGLRCPHCVRDDYGGQRERSGIARAAVPRRAGPDVFRGAIRCPSGSQAVFCVRPLWWTGELSTSRQTPGERIHQRCQARADRHPAPVVRQLSFSGRSVLQSPAHAGAQVFALLPRG